MSDRAKPLRGLRILIVDDEYLIARDPAAHLAERGASIAALASCARDALAALETPIGVDAVVLDVLPDGSGAEALADVLRGRGIPFVLVTGLEEDALPPSLQGQPRSDKPCDYDRIARLIRARCRASDHPPSVPPSTRRDTVGSPEA